MPPNEKDKTTHQKTTERLMEENRVLSIRLTLAQAWAAFLQFAYDTLLSFGINYRNMPTYQDTAALDEANDATPEEGHAGIMGWIGRIERDLVAAVRRKGLKLLSSPNKDDDDE
jgi:hypothetical protein